MFVSAVCLLKIELKLKWFKMIEAFCCSLRINIVWFSSFKENNEIYTSGINRIIIAGSEKAAFNFIKHFNTLKYNYLRIFYYI